MTLTELDKIIAYVNYKRILISWHNIFKQVYL